jgi:hypothetical protein
MAKKLLFPSDARTWVRQRYGRQHRSWLVGGGVWPLNVSLGQPTERDVTNNAGHLREWVDAWSTWDGGALAWNEVQWPKLGRQRLPLRLELASADGVAALLGEEARFRQARQRYEDLARRWLALEESTPLARYFDMLADYPDAEYRRLVDLLSWLMENPKSQHALRELPIEGLDTKWIEKSRRAMVAELLQSIRGEPLGSDFYEVCGLRRPAHRVRLLVLCPELRRPFCGLRDLETPLQELARLPIAPARVLIVENQESGLPLPDIPDTVALIKLGASVAALSAIPWITASDIVYWGDVDTHGFAILNWARAALGNVTSVLMDEATLLEHRKLWGSEPEPYGDSDLANLTTAEQSLFQNLRRGRWGSNVRLEQERIPWQHALAAVLRACGSARTSGAVEPPEP